MCEISQWIGFIPDRRVFSAKIDTHHWSVFTRKLTDVDGIYQFSASETAWIFSAGLATFAIVMVLAGRWLPKAGPRRLTVLGGTLLGAGYILAGLFGSSFWTQLLFIGVVGGAGIGLAYVVPIAVGVVCLLGGVIIYFARSPQEHKKPIKHRLPGGAVGASRH